ncbi:MAG: hypothetical protein R2750_14300 [Bacteroidales bacterium]
MDEKNKANYKSGGIIFVGCMFIGMGIGYFLGELQTGLFLGMGVGFIVMGFLTIRASKNK